MNRGYFSSSMLQSEQAYEFKLDTVPGTWKRINGKRLQLNELIDAVYRYYI